MKTFLTYILEYIVFFILWGAYGFTIAITFASLVYLIIRWNNHNRKIIRSFSIMHEIKLKAICEKLGIPNERLMQLEIDMWMDIDPKIKEEFYKDYKSISL